MKATIWIALILIGLQTPVSSVIDGVMLDAGSNLPVAGVQITLTAPGALSLSATSDSEGKFAFDNIQPGSYRIATRKDGYASAHADGRTTPGNAGIPVSVKRGEAVRGLPVHVLPNAVVTGRVLDTNGRPVARARVSLMRKVFDETGAPTMSALAGAVSDDRGEYRIYGIFPGSYMVFVDSVSASGMATVPTWYPGTTDSEKASLIAFKSGDESRLGDMTVSTFKALPLQLHIRNETGQQAPLMVIEVRKDGVTGLNMAIPAPPEVYTLTSLAPGTYDLAVGLQGEDGFLFTHVATRAEDWQADATVTIRKGRRVTGRVEIQDTNGKLRPAAGVQTTLGFSGSADIRAGFSQADGSFVLDGVTEGLRRVRVEGLAADAYIVAVKEGERDILNDGIQITGDTNIHVMIAESGGMLDGKVVNSEGRSIVDGTLVLVPDGEDQSKSYRFRTASTDQNGSFSLRGIAPGAYHLYAWQEMEGAAYRNAEFMKAFEGQGKAVNIVAGGQVADLKVLDGGSQK